MFLWRGNGGGMVEPWQCEEMQKKNVEQTKIWAYGKQLELKKGLEVLNYEGIVHFFLGAQCG